MAVLAARAPALIPRSAWLRLLGPAFIVSVGYIDPGNWATDLAAGLYGFKLLWVIAVANAIAIVLQCAVTRLAIITGTDLATAVAVRWPSIAPFVWPVFQGAAITTDFAEFTGIVLGLELLFHLSLLTSVLLGAGAVLVLLMASDIRRSKVFEAAIISIVLAVAFAYVYQVCLVHPSAVDMMNGTFVPRIPDQAALFIVVGIIGATVMPHNLFLHSALVAKGCASGEGVHSAIERQRRGQFFMKETIVALNLAAIINGAILVVGSSLGGAGGSIQQASGMLGSIAGNKAALVFGASLLLCGLAASAAATLSGDYIFAAFSPIRVKPPLRRLITLVPAALLLLIGLNPITLLVGSQVALALILPVVLIPLIALIGGTRRGNRSPAFSSRLFVSVLAATGVCIAFDGLLIARSFSWV